MAPLSRTPRVSMAPLSSTGWHRWVDSLGGDGGTSEFCSRAYGGTCEFSSSSGVSMASKFYTRGNDSNSEFYSEG